ncbi:AIPR family protein, partial [Vibrio parahaemolyticus]
EYKDCDITVVFVPTSEIGRVLYTYRNSILKYNPRCYLEMKANTVNNEIYSTIKNKNTNEFALFNNGITMLSDETNVNERIGQKDKAQILISNPQIINGGQTA